MVLTTDVDQDVKTLERVTWLPEDDVRRTEMGRVNWTDLSNTYAYDVSSSAVHVETAPASMISTLDVVCDPPLTITPSHHALDPEFICTFRPPPVAGVDEPDEEDDEVVDEDVDEAEVEEEE